MILRATYSKFLSQNVAGKTKLTVKFMHFVANCIFAIGLKIKELEKFLEHVARLIKRRSIIIKFSFTKTVIYMKVQNAICIDNFETREMLAGENINGNAF